jgi:predicted dinucleotide-binding enzyme
LLELLTDDVNWPNGDTRLIGKAAVRQYWLRQFTETRTHDEPVRFIDLSPDKIAVHIDQTVENRHGRVLSRGAFRYSFDIRAGLISRLDVSVVTTIGFIGSGDIGSTLARLALDAGYDVALSNSCGPETLADLVGESGSSARAVTTDGAAGAGDVVVVTIPLEAYRAVPVRPLAGKVVIDTNNHFPHRDGDFPQLQAETNTTSELLQRHLPTSHVVRAFDDISSAELATQGQPAGTPGRRGLAIAGGDAVARKTVSALIDEFGYDATPT